MKRIKKALSLLLALCMVTAVLPIAAFADSSGAFPDIPSNASYAEAVAVLSEMGIVTGDDKGNFNPNSTIKRSEAATIICRLMSVEDEAKSMKKQIFTDVPAQHWAVGYVAKAVEMGVINGFGDGTFKPDDPITYEQMIKLLICAWGYSDSAIEAGGYPNGYLNVAKQLGIANSLSFKGPDFAPRSAVAVMAYEMLFIYQNFD